MKMLPFSSVSIQLARRPKEMQGCLPPTSGCLLATDQFPVLGILNQVNTSESPVYLHVCSVQGVAKSQQITGTIADLGRKFVGRRAACHIKIFPVSKKLVCRVRFGPSDGQFRNKAPLLDGQQGFSPCMELSTTIFPRRSASRSWISPLQPNSQSSKLRKNSIGSAGARLGGSIVASSCLVAKNYS